MPGYDGWGPPWLWGAEDQIWWGLMYLWCTLFVLVMVLAVLACGKLAGAVITRCNACALRRAQARVPPPPSPQTSPRVPPSVRYPSWGEVGGGQGRMFAGSANDESTSSSDEEAALRRPLLAGK